MVTQPIEHEQLALLRGDADRAELELGAQLVRQRSRLGAVGRLPM
jgi:hypothetical protein